MHKRSDIALQLQPWVVLFPVVFLVGGLLAAVYVVYAAPVLLAEILLDAVLVSGLYRRLHKLERQNWLATAVRKTWLPVTAVATLVTTAGLILQMISPKADSIGDLFRTL